MCLLKVTCSQDLPTLRGRIKTVNTGAVFEEMKLVPVEISLFQLRMGTILSTPISS